jgi:hypothetical protein
MLGGVSAAHERIVDLTDIFAANVQSETAVADVCGFVLGHRWRLGRCGRREFSTQNQRQASLWLRNSGEFNFSGVVGTGAGPAVFEGGLAACFVPRF